MRLVLAAVALGAVTACSCFDNVRPRRPAAPPARESAEPFRGLDGSADAAAPRRPAMKDPAEFIPPRPDGGVVQASASEPAPPPAPAKPHPVAAVVAAGRAAFDRIDGLEADLVRREVVRGKQSPDEEIAYRYRKQPQSFHLRWVGAEGAAGRWPSWRPGRTPRSKS